MQSTAWTETVKSFNASWPSTHTVPLQCALINNIIIIIIIISKQHVELGGHYICWAFSSSTDISRSFIWPLSSSRSELESSDSGRNRLPWETLLELEAIAAAGLGSFSVLVRLGFWKEGECDRMFAAGCVEEEKNKENKKVEIIIIMKGINSKHFRFDAS